jgi:hypothetical protein
MFSHREVGDFYWDKMTVNTTKKFLIFIYRIFSQKMFSHREVADFYWAKMTVNTKNILSFVEFFFNFQPPRSG